VLKRENRAQLAYSAESAGNSRQIQPNTEHKSRREYPYKKQIGEEDQRNSRDPNFAISLKIWRQKKLIQTATGRQGKCEM
jgi:hypothetical protein